MAKPFLLNALSGLLGARTASFFRLDPTGSVPIEPLGDLVPALNSNRVTLDMVDTESMLQSYQITQNAMQDFQSASTNRHKNLDIMTLTGTLTSAATLVDAFETLRKGPILSLKEAIFSGLRTDLAKLANLRVLADRDEPIMVVTPRESLAKAFIESITTTWNPEVADNTLVSITLIEARIVNPFFADAVVGDLAASETGNNSVTSGGSQSPTPVETQTVTEPVVQGQAPTVVA